MNEALKVYASPLPFSNKQTLVKALPGSTLRQIVNNVVPDKYKAAGVAAVVMVNGEIIPMEYWASVRPKTGTLVNVRVVPQGGGGGGKKNPLATILSIAVLVAAPYIAGAILGPTLAATQIGIGTLTYGGLLSSAIGVVGRLAISALAPPPKPSATAFSGGASNPAESPTQFIEGARNSLNPFGVVPINLGTNRMFPFQAARPYTETAGNDQFVRQLFTWGYGDEISLADIKIGETAITEFSDYEMEHKLEGNLHEGTDLFSNDPFQDDMSVFLETDVDVVRTTQPNADEAILDITFTQGLVGYSGDGEKFQLSVDFEIYYRTTGVGGYTLYTTKNVKGTQQEALRVSERIVFPATGQYDIKVVRITDDYGPERFDDAFLTAIKTFTYRNPINLVGINGTAIRIKGTDQLNGALDQFNAVVSTHVPDYDAGTDSWITRATSNPASIYRYVLQCLANGKRLPDSKIIVADFEAWHTHCVNKGYEYNRVIDYETSVDEVLRDIASAGAASPAIVDGKRTIVVDKVKDDIVQIITPRNSWGYQGEMIYPELPHAFRVQFRNKDKGYAQDERIVYDDGYNADNATEYETLEWQSCTNSDLAFKHGRRNIAGARLRPENHTWMMDVENLVALRGNRVKLEHDAPIIGVGDGRIKTVTTDGNSPALVTGFTIDDTVTIPNSGTYYVRVRLADGTQLYKELVTSVGNTSTFTFAVPFTVDDAPAAGDLCYFVEAGGELDLIITRIEPQDDLTARMAGVDYAQPAIDDAENAAIPVFNSNITTPLEFIRPLAPLLVAEQSDESVMLRNSDGTFTTRAVFTLENLNDNDVTPFVKIRSAGSTAFTTASTLELSPGRVSITGMDDGKSYDIHIRYKRNNSSLFSKALEINNYLFLGASGTPEQVQDFSINVVGETAIFKWTKNEEIDIDFYTIKYSPLYSGVTWATAQILEEKIYDVRYVTLFRGGTYLIKAVDILGNESDTATAIITYNPGQIANAEAQLVEDSDFPGVKDNTGIVDGRLVILDTDSDGYYYFEETVNLDGVFQCIVSASVAANGIFINNLFDENDIFAMADVFGEGGNDLFSETDIFALDDVFGIGTDAWALEIQYRTTQTDPDNSPPDWGAWTRLDAGILQFYAIQFRLKMTSLRQYVSPGVTLLRANVDMPDRIERGEDMTVPVGGTSVTFTPEFRETPAIAITIQDGAVDDRIEFTAKGAGGFSFKVYNETAAGYVERSFDYIASGWGRKNA